jgi:recombination protein RecT
MENTPNTQNKSLALKKMQEETVNNVLERVQMLKEAGDLHLPEHYSAGNALKLAWLNLQTVQDRSKRPVLESCTKDSICNALLEMTIKGLSVSKKQGYFIAYGNQLTFQPDYRGNLAIAKRDVGVLEVNAQVIYEGDEYVTRIDERGVKQLERHITKLDNINLGKIKGAYAVVVFNGGRTKLEDMTLDMIKKAWEQGAAGGKSGAHLNFTDQMCKKTVINRALKIEIGSSDDSEIMPPNENIHPADKARDNGLKQANTQELPEDVQYEDVSEMAPEKQEPDGPGF